MDPSKNNSEDVTFKQTLDTKERANTVSQIRYYIHIIATYIIHLLKHFSLYNNKNVSILSCRLKLLFQENRNRKVVFGTDGIWKRVFSTSRAYLFGELPTIVNCHPNSRTYVSQMSAKSATKFLTLIPKPRTTIWVKNMERMSMFILPTSLGIQTKQIFQSKFIGTPKKDSNIGKVNAEFARNLLYLLMFEMLIWKAKCIWKI